MDSAQATAIIKKHVTALEMAGGKCYLSQSSTRLGNSRQFQPKEGRHSYSKSTAGGLYLQQSIGDTCKTDLVFSKTCLATQGMTIPRLELLGVLNGVRALWKELHQEVSCHLFTDSVCVL